MNESALIAVAPSYRRAGWAAIASGIIGITACGLILDVLLTRVSWIPSDRIWMLCRTHRYQSLSNPLSNNLVGSNSLPRESNYRTISVVGKRVIALCIVTAAIAAYAADSGPIVTVTG